MFETIHDRRNVRTPTATSPLATKTPAPHRAVHQLSVGLTVAVVTAALIAAPLTGIASFEDGTSTSPLAVWYSPGTVNNCSGGYDGSRSVCVTGNVRIGVSPTASQTDLVFWIKSGTAQGFTGQVQYFDASSPWKKLGQDFIQFNVDTTWREQIVHLNKPAGTANIFVGIWVPAGVTANIDYVYLTPTQVSPSRPFTENSAWNGFRPYQPESHSELSSVHWWVNREQFSIPLVYSSTTDPVVAVAIPSSWGRPTQTISVRIPVGVTGASGTDASLLVVDPAGTAHSFWQFSRSSNTAATAQSYGSTPVATGDGFVDPVTGLNAGIRACGSSLLGGMLAGPLTNDISHALAISLPNSMLKMGWVSPCIAEDGDGPWAYKGQIRMGSRLVATGSMPAGLSPVGQVIFRAAAQYGFLVVDRSDTPTLYADPRSTTTADVDQLRVWWCSTCNGTSDLDLIVPRLVVAVY